MGTKMIAIHPYITTKQKNDLKKLSNQLRTGMSVLIREGIDRVLTNPSVSNNETLENPNKKVLLITEHRAIDGLRSFKIPVKELTIESLLDVDNDVEFTDELGKENTVIRKRKSHTLGIRFPGPTPTSLGNRPVSDHNLAGKIYNLLKRYMSDQGLKNITRTEIENLCTEKHSEFGKKRGWKASGTITQMYKNGNLIANVLD